MLGLGVQEEVQCLNSLVSGLTGAHDRVAGDLLTEGSWCEVFRFLDRNVNMIPPDFVVGQGERSMI